MAASAYNLSIGGQRQVTPESSLASQHSSKSKLLVQCSREPEKMPKPTPPAHTPEPHHTQSVKVFAIIVSLFTIFLINNNVL